MLVSKSGSSKAMFALPLVAILLISSVAKAAAEEEDKEGPYVGVALATGVELFDEKTYKFTPVVDPEDHPTIDGEFPSLNFDNFDYPIGFNLWGGYRINSYWAVEGEVGFLTGFDSKAPIGKFKASTLDVTVNVKFYPLSGWLQPYAVLGVGGGRYDVKEVGESREGVGILFRIGAGMEYDITDSIAIVAGADRLKTLGHIKDFDHVQFKLGTQYKF